jgi:hypothetical protein
VVPFPTGTDKLDTSDESKRHNAAEHHTPTRPRKRSNSLSGPAPANVYGQGSVAPANSPPLPKTNSNPALTTNSNFNNSLLSPPVDPRNDTANGFLAPGKLPGAEHGKDTAGYRSPLRPRPRINTIMNFVLPELKISKKSLSPTSATSPTESPESSRRVLGTALASPIDTKAFENTPKKENYIIKLLDGKLNKPAGDNKSDAKAFSTNQEDKIPVNGKLFHPEGIKLQIWNSIYVSTLYCRSILMMAFIAFDHSWGYLVLPFSIAFALLTVADLIIRSRTIIIEDKEIITDPKVLARRHILSGSFLCDIVLAFPYVLFTDTLSTSLTQKTYLRMLSILNSLVYLEMLFRKRKSYINEKLKKLYQKYSINLALVDSFGILIGMILYWYYKSNIGIFSRV